MVERSIIRSISLERGLQVTKLPFRTGVTIDNGTIAFDDLESARQFSEALANAIKRCERKREG